MEISRFISGRKHHQGIFVLAPRINNPNELGEIYKFCHGVSGLSLRDDNCYLAELRCSFDPNDKFAIPQREDQYSLKGEPLVYTIRFQNTGNDYARNVIIRDNIDRSFNLNSLKILQTSHPDILEVSYDDARVLIFSFKDIFCRIALQTTKAAMVMSFIL